MVWVPFHIWKGLAEENLKLIVLSGIPILLKCQLEFCVMLLH
jgi:hypothetical protein